MIRPEKTVGALRAINVIFVLARDLARKGMTRELERILDTAEYLPLLMLDPEEQTIAFREHLVELGQEFPMFKLAVQRFDDPG